MALRRAEWREQQFGVQSLTACRHAAGGKHDRRALHHHLIGNPNGFTRIAGRPERGERLSSQLSTEKSADMSPGEPEADVTACLPFKDEEVRQQRTDFLRFDLVAAREIPFAPQPVPVSQ
ncbi:hypothetical protein ILFOPFJJ_04413 [Ensifer psoraleae]|nr:hypothetical protein [Sinorhizobium psoraleae]